MVENRIQMCQGMAIKESVPPHNQVIAGHEVQMIVDYARDHHFDLVAIGFMEHPKIYDRVWGSTSQNIAHLMLCTVMVAK
jgi:nucleotide-binding universal stress UspA family protein